MQQRLTLGNTEEEGKQARGHESEREHLRKTTFVQKHVYLSELAVTFEVTTVMSTRLKVNLILQTRFQRTNRRAEFSQSSNPVFLCRPGLRRLAEALPKHVEKRQLPQ